jgi:hypothetical protein
MLEVIRQSTNHVAMAPADAQTMHRMALFMQRELGPFEVDFNAVEKMPGSSVADVRNKALDAAEELMIRHHRELLLGNDNITGACRKSGRSPEHAREMTDTLQGGRTPGTTATQRRHPQTSPPKAEPSECLTNDRRKRATATSYQQPSLSSYTKAATYLKAVPSRRVRRWGSAAAQAKA